MTLEGLVEKFPTFHGTQNFITAPKAAASRHYQKPSKSSLDHTILL
jgi:hypothetical protein